MHTTEAESEGLATFGGGIGSMLPMQHVRRCLHTQSRIAATRAIALSLCFAVVDILR